MILVLPIGSSEAERGFSVMNHIKNKRRSKLIPSHMQDIMRIRLNGVNELEKFPATKYAYEFTKNHLKTDDPRWSKQVVEESLEVTDNESVNDNEVKRQKKKKFLPKISFL